VAFLREKDYFKQIAQGHLEEILEQAEGISGDADIRLMAEVTAIARAKEKLTQRYKVNKIFTDLLTFDISTNYKWGDRIDFTAPLFDATTIYSSGTILVYNSGTVAQPINKIYQKNSNVTSYVAGTLPIDLSYFDLRGDENIYYLTAPSDWDEDVNYPATTGLCTYKHEYYVRTANTSGYNITGQPHNDPGTQPIYSMWADIGVSNYIPLVNPSPYGNNTTPENTQFWTKILDFTPYFIVGVWPVDNIKWTKGDNRSLTLVKAIIDLALYVVHGVINPNQVPKLRYDRYKEAEQWLDDCGNGNITPDLPTFTEDFQKGFAIRFGSNPPTTHSY
jgi:hypothetical protein